jgi:hypothetical protein
LLQSEKQENNSKSNEASNRTGMKLLIATLLKWRAAACSTVLGSSLKLNINKHETKTSSPQT